MGLANQRSGEDSFVTRESQKETESFGTSENPALILIKALTVTVHPSLSHTNNNNKHTHTHTHTHTHYTFSPLHTDTYLHTHSLTIPFFLKQTHSFCVYFCFSPFFTHLLTRPSLFFSLSFLSS